LRGPKKIRVQFDVITVRTGVPELLPVIVRFDDIRVYGAGRNPSQFQTDLNLKGKPNGKFEVTIMPGSTETGRFKIPLVLMPTGEAEQYEKRYDQRGTPQAVAAKVRVCLDMMKQGIAQGVVPYRTPLLPKDPFFEAIQREYEAFSAAPVNTE